MRRPALVLTALLVALCWALAATPAGADRAERKKPTLTSTPAAPLQGTEQTLATKLPTRFKRKVQLQRQTAGRWATVAKARTKRNGKVSFTVTALGDATYRVVAKRVRHHGKRYKKVVTKPAAVSVTLRAELVSATPAGVSSGAESSGAAVSADGRYVAFISSATTLAPGTSGYLPERTNVFLRDRATGQTVLVSHKRNAPTVAGNSASWWPRISADGRYVAFVSAADDLVAGDDEGHQDIFRWDRSSGNIIRISSAGAGGGADGDSYDPSISAAGDVIAYASAATDIDADDGNGLVDVFAWDADTGESDRVSLDILGNDPNGASSSGIVSAGGDYVVFASTASDLTIGDTNGKRDVFRRDLGADSTTIVSRGADGGADADASGGRTAITPDGRYVAFASLADNLVAGGTPDNGKLNVFVRDLTTQSTVLVSGNPAGGPTSGHSLPPDWISADGRLVLFTTLAPELVPGDADGDAADAVLWDRGTGASSTILRNRTGGQPNGAVYEPTLSADGRWLAFYSVASDLVPNDPNDAADVYVWRMP
jgi:Tol biopolymer transport system component